MTKEFNYMTRFCNLNQEIKSIRQKDRQTKTKSPRQTKTDRQTKTYRQTKTKRQTKTHRQTNTERQTDKD